MPRSISKVKSKKKYSSDEEEIVHKKEKSSSNPKKASTKKKPKKKEKSSSNPKKASTKKKPKKKEKSSSSPKKASTKKKPKKKEKSSSSPKKKPKKKDVSISKKKPKKKDVSKKKPEKKEMSSSSLNKKHKKKDVSSSKKKPEKKEMSSSSSEKKPKKKDVLSSKKKPKNKEPSSSSVKKTSKKKKPKKKAKSSSSKQIVIRKKIVNKSSPEEKKVSNKKKMKDSSSEEDVKFAVSPKIKTADGGTWNPNEPFVIHFLLDGFITDNLGNNTENVAIRMLDLLNRGIIHEWEGKAKKEMQNIASEIKIGLDYTKKIVKSYGELFSFTPTDGMEARSKDISDKILSSDMIIASGYQNESSGHAISFRLQFSSLEITLTNSGAGLQYHKNGPHGKKKLYIRWKYSTYEEYVIDARIAISSINQNTINTASIFYNSVVDKMSSKSRINSVYLDNGVIKEVEACWMTSKQKYIVDKGILYCDRQITGTCSFHSVYWQILLAIWGIEGSMGASIFEYRSRYFILESGIKLQDLEYPRIAEQISCLQLLVRLYQSFKARDTVLSTLMYIDSKVHNHKNSSFIYDLPVVKKEHFITRLKDITHSLVNVHLIGDVLNKLVIILLSVFRDLYLFFKVSTLGFDSKDSIFVYFWLNEAIAAIKYVHTLQVKNTSSIDMQKITLCSKYFNIILNLLERNGVNSNKIKDYKKINTLLISIAANVYYSLSSADQIPPHIGKTERKWIEYIAPGNINCTTYNFIKDYARYSADLKSDITYGTEQVEMYKAAMKDRIKQNKVPFFIGTISLYMVNRLIVEEFVKTSHVHEALACLFYMDKLTSEQTYNKQVDNTYKDPNYGSFYYQMHLDSKDLKENITNYSEATGIISDLESGIPLTKIKLNNSLPQEDNLSYFCDDRKTEELIKDGKEYVLPEDFYNIRSQWMKDVWVNTVLSIKEVLTNEPIVKVCYSWLIYLWPVVPDLLVFKDLLKAVQKYLSTNEANLTIILLAFWLSNGKIGEPEYLLKEIKKIIKTSENNLPNLFLQQLIRYPDVNLAILTKLDILPRNTIDKSYILDEKYSWSLYLKSVEWPIKDIKHEYSIEDKRLVFPTEGNKSYLYYIWKDAVSKSIPCSMWDEKGYVTLHLNIGDDEITLHKDKIMLPNEEIYKVALPEEVPLCMRQWCSYYNNCVSIPLKQDINGIIKWFFFLAGVNRVTLKNTVFDRAEKIPKPIYSPALWYVFSMQDSCLMPILNRDTLGWPFLFLHLMDSVKITCLEFIRNTIPYFKRSTTILSEYIPEELPTPSMYKLVADRKIYMSYLEDKYDPLPINTSKLESIMAGRICACIGPLPIQRYLEDIIKLVYINNKRDISTITNDKARMLFEAITGFLVRPNQIELIDNMLENISNKEAKVHIALMGIGKSKVIMPILTIMSLLNYEEVLIVQPIHLVPQTLTTLDEILPLIFDKEDFTVLDDISAKDMYLNTQTTSAYKKNNRVVLFDEVDFMYNTHKSEYNKPEDEIFHPITDIPKEKYCQYVVDNCYNGESNLNHRFRKDFPLFFKKFSKNVIESKKMKYFYEYGASDIETEMLAVPYIAVGTPVYKSNFSDIDLAALLTCHIRRKQGLLPRDFIFLQERIRVWESLIGNNKIANISTSDLLAPSPAEAVKLYGKNKELQQFYLINLLLPEKLRCYKNQYNLSFIDLMNPSFSTKRIGFSGTQLIHLPQFNTYTWKAIVPDDIGTSKIKQSILGWQPHEKGIYEYSYENMWKIIIAKGITVLIDADALLRDYGESIEVVAQWAEEEKNTNYVYVFIDEQHYMKEYKYGQRTNFPLYKYRDNITFRWYFDQRHTIGIDMKIAPKAKALTLVSDTTKITPVAQAIYRLRGIAQDGQSTEFMLHLENIKMPDNREILYNLFIQNDLEYKDSMLHRHYIQNYKTVVREDTKHIIDSYKEKIKYYPNEIVLYEPVKISALAKKLKDKVYATESKGEVNLESQVMQEQQVEKLVILNGTCVKQDIYFNLELNYYDSITTIDNIVFSPYVNLQQNDAMLPENLAFIYQKQYNSCLIITIAEELFLKSRGITLKNKIVHRYDTIPVDATANYNLGIAICGKHIALDKQLLVIRDVINKPFLLNIWKCYKALNYDIMRDYFMSSLYSTEYIKKFHKETDLKVFMNKWVRWQITTSEIEDYWQVCLTIIS